MQSEQQIDFSNNKAVCQAALKNSFIEDSFAGIIVHEFGSRSYYADYDHLRKSHTAIRVWEAINNPAYLTK